jgi:tetratricopeptide (TPR) repeat protein
MQKPPVLLTICAALALCACNTTPNKPAASNRIEIVESVGFTIVEESRVGTGVRGDYDRALELLAQGDVDEGIALLESASEKAPELSAPHIDLGIAYHRQEDLEAAERHLQRALEINTEHPIVLNELGIIYRKTARFAEARQSYEAALAVFPGYHFARRNLAVLCELYLADLECALGNYEAYMAVVQSDDEASMWLKNLRYQMGKTELE